MNKIEEHGLSYISPSAVTFSSEINENDLKSKSDGNPDWTIQREISITFDKTINDSPPPKFFSKKTRIIIASVISIILILSIVLPIMILTIGPHFPTTTVIKTTTIITTQIASNFSTRKLRTLQCSNLISIPNVNFIGFDLLSKSSMTWSNCCSWCLNISSCRAFTYQRISSICYLKTMINKNELFDIDYESARYP